MAEPTKGAPAYGAGNGAGAFINGMGTGLFLQLAIGPVFFFVAGIALSSGYAVSLFAVAAVTLVDYLYIALALGGLGAIMRQERFRKIFGILGALVLIGFGAITLLGSFRPSGLSEGRGAWTPFSSFTSAFLLTVSSPLTVVFWTSVFAAKATDKGYRRGGLALFGLGAGLATLVFLTISALLLSFFRARIPSLAVQALNAAVGVAILAFAGIRIFRSFKPKQTETR